MTTVLLVRHGETAWNRERRIQGWAPVGLTERGHEQARTLGAHLADRYDVDRLVASDLRRTKETARTIARETGTSPTFDRGWRERDFGVYQGLSYEALFDGYPEFALDQVGHSAARARPEGGESLLAARERVLDAFDRLLDAADGTVVVITHGGPIRIVLGHLRGLDVVEAVRGLDVANCSISELRTTDDGVSVARECAIVPDTPRATRDGRDTY